MPMFFQGMPYAGSGTFAAKPAANTVPAGTIYRASDLGENGAYIESNGTRWRLVQGEAALKTLGAATAAINNVETIVLQTLLPAGTWQQYDTIRVRLAMTKSGTTDTGQVTVRVGSAGTTADTAILGLSGFVVLTAAGRSTGVEFDVKLLTATSAQKMGNNVAGSSSYGGTGATAAANATTITDASANALYVSVGIASSSTNDTVAMQSGVIQLATP
jgi:hypothetical protein